MDAILELLSAQVESITRKIDSFGGQHIQSVYNQPQTSYVPNFYHPNYHPDFSWSNNSQYQPFDPWISYPSEFSYPPPQRSMQKSNLEELLDRFIEGTEKYNQEVFASELSYQAEVLYEQPPPQQKETSNLEDVLARFIAETEKRMNNQDKFLEQMERNMKSNVISIQNLTNQVEQIINVINCCPQDPLPSGPNFIPEMVDKELCEADSVENGEEFYVVIEKNIESSHTVVDDDFIDENSWSQIEVKEKLDEDDQVGDSTSFVQLPVVPLVQYLHPVQEHVECFRIEFKEDINIIAEFKFGGDLHSCEHAMKIKEKTKRRHEKTIFAIEPD